MLMMRIFIGGFFACAIGIGVGQDIADHAYGPTATSVAFSMLGVALCWVGLVTMVIGGVGALVQRISR